MTEREPTVPAGTRRVLAIARGVLSDLDLEVVLKRVVKAAREVSSAKYAALGVLDRSRSGTCTRPRRAVAWRFSEEDLDAVLVLADFAGVAVDHARRFAGLEARHAQLRRTVEPLDAMLQIARALSGETHLDVILGLVAKRGRALVSARAPVIERAQGVEMVIVAGAGDLPEGVLSQRIDARERESAYPAWRSAIGPIGTSSIRVTRSRDAVYPG